MNTPDTEWSSVKEQVYNLVKEVHIQKPFEDVTGEPHYVTDQIMKLISSRDTYWKERVREAVKEEDERIIEEMSKEYSGPFCTRFYEVMGISDGIHGMSSDTPTPITKDSLK